MSKRRVVTHDIVGWDRIADALGVSRTAVIQWAKRKVDPLPVKVFIGRAVARLDDLREWAERNTKPVG